MQRVFVAGHKGMVGSAICRQLQSKDIDLVTADRKELDLTNQAEAHVFFEKNKFDEVYLAAAKVGGILANSKYPSDFIYQNLMIQNNVVHQCFLSGVKKLLFLGSSCIYPKLAKQPIDESALLSGYLEPTNEPYAIAKIAGIKLCESYNRQFGTDYRSIMPTNLYGPEDNYSLEDSHVIPGLIRRFHDAKLSCADTVTIWGSGTPKREFLHVDDMASASIFLMNLDKTIFDVNTDPMQHHINAGSGKEITIRELAEKIKNVVGFKGSVTFDSSMPDGSPRKLMSSNRINNLGWHPVIDLDWGLEQSYRAFSTTSGL
jgi:GDP-L-fucose synthase